MAIVLDGTLGTTTPALTDSALTSGRVTYAGTSGVLQDSANLTFDGSYFTVASGAGAFLADIAQVSGTPTKVNANGVGLEFRGGTAPSVTGYNRTTSAYLPITLDTSASIFSISGTEGMRLTSTGLGIGTSSPAYKLDVSGTGSVVARISGSTNSSLILNAASGFFNYVQYSSAGSGGLQFYDVTNAANRMLLDSSGNLGIGTTSPSASAILDAQSTTKGVRMPNMTTTQKNAISSPAAGLMVFDTTLAKLCVYSGSAWQTITSV